MTKPTKFDFNLTFALGKSNKPSSNNLPLTELSGQTCTKQFQVS
jgi:hypothetical protein